MDDIYFKDVCEAFPKLKAPVLFVLLGERGKEAFPFIERTRGGMGDAVQMLQIADSEYRVQDPSVEFVDICSPNWEDDINKALGIYIIPILKTNSYLNKSMIVVNFLIDLNDKDSINIKVIAENIYNHLETVFVNCVDCYYYCFSEVSFLKDRSASIKASVIERIQDIQIQQKKEKEWKEESFVYIVSDLNEADVYSKNNFRKYLALTLNTYLQAGYHVDADEAIFDSYLFASSHKQYRVEPGNEKKQEIFYQAMGCAPIELNREFMKAFFKMRITEYIKDYEDDQGVIMDIFSAFGDEKHIITETFDNTVPNYFESAEYIAYNQTVLRDDTENVNNRTWLRRFFNNNHQEFFENNVSTVFFERLKVAICDNSRNLDKRLIEAIEEGKINPFHTHKFEKQTDYGEKTIINCEEKLLELEETIRTLESEAVQLESNLRAWEDSIESLKRYVLFDDKMMNRFRRQLIGKWLRRKRLIVIQEGLIRYTHMERDCILRMLELAKRCQYVGDKFINSCKNTYSRLERAAFSYQTDHFDEYYSSKTNETMERHITAQEKKILFTAFCKYMLDEKNGYLQFNAALEEFISGDFWRQGKIKNHLIEEILDRMRAAGQKNTDDVFMQLYKSTVEAKNVDLRVISSNTTDNDACCFIGPSDNMFISFLQRYKQKDSRVHVLVVDQLTIPVVLYFKFNIKENEIKV